MSRNEITFTRKEKNTFCGFKDAMEINNAPPSSNLEVRMKPDLKKKNSSNRGIAMTPDLKKVRFDIPKKFAPVSTKVIRTSTEGNFNLFLCCYI